MLYKYRAELSENTEQAEQEVLKMTETTATEHAEIKTILPSLEDLEKVITENNEWFEKKAEEIAKEVATNLKTIMQRSAEEILRKEGAILGIPEDYFKESENAPVPVKEIQERSMQIIVATLNSGGLKASYNRPKSDNDNGGNWSINISKR